MKRAEKMATVLVLVTAGFAAFVTDSHARTVSKNYDKTKYRSVGILVTRMGHFISANLKPISSDTDYSIRIPTYKRNVWDSKCQDVYIESDERLHESLPDYPHYRHEKQVLVGDIDETYCQNITPAIQESCSAFFRERGYDVVNVRDVASNWDPPLSEMTIGAIVQKLRGVADMLFVLHYMDVGSFQVHDSHGAWNKFDVKRSGLVRLDNAIAVFGISSGERLVERGDQQLLVHSRIFRDPKLQKDPRYSGRIRVISKREEKMDSSDWRKRYITTSEKFESDLTPDEMVEIAMGYLREELAKVIP